MKYVSLFAGIGGFDLALNRLGHECVYVNEWDKYAAQTYEKNFGHRPDTRDIKIIPGSDFPEHDILVGGFPCQTFSVAGKRKGFNETRGTLFFDIARILADKRPRYFVLENVKGLLSHDKGKTFSTILGVLTDLGYELQWQVLNSKNFGVPQNRERVFIVGYFRETSRPKIFPITKSDSFSSSKVEGEQRKGSWISSTVDSRYGALRNAGETYLSNFAGDILQRVSNEGAVIRKLTPVECERLQGFPDNWTEGVSDTQRYKQLGNAVTVNVVEAIMRKMQ